MHVLTHQHTSNGGTAFYTSSKSPQISQNLLNFITYTRTAPYLYTVTVFDAAESFTHNPGPIKEHQTLCIGFAADPTKLLYDLIIVSMYEYERGAGRVYHPP